MAYLTKEERAAKRKADRKRGEKTEKKIGSWLGDVPSKLKSISDKQKAKNKADREKRKAKREKEAKAHSAKMADRKKATKARVAAADAKAKAAKAAREAKKTTKAKTAKTTKAKTAKTTKAKTTKTTKAKKKTYSDRVAKREGKKIDYTDPAVREKLTKYKKDPDTGRAGVQSLFGGKGKKQKVASTTTPKGDGFGAAFKKARKAYMGGGKEKTFDWRGKEYHTRWKDETPKQQLAARKGQTKGVDDWQKKVAKKWGGGKI
mgnify:CR=1 FL=1|tara:strand:- start:147 stop:929 length:783 start_codon:yes stop_codon:yes gene_type:complete